MLVVLAYKARLNLYSLQFKRMRSETQGPEGAYKSGCQEDVSPPPRGNLEIQDIDSEQSRPRQADFHSARKEEFWREGNKGKLKP